MNVPEGIRYGLYTLLSVAHLPSVNKFSNDIKKIKGMIRQKNVMSVSRWSQKTLLHVCTFPSEHCTEIVQNVKVT